jgi:hypothetical protein
VIPQIRIWLCRLGRSGAVPSIILDEGMKRLSNEIVGSQNHGSIGLGLLFEELARCSLFNYFAQPHKLIYALIWLHVTPTFKIVHRRAIDCAQNYLALIEHREFNDHSIEVVILDLTSLQRHCATPIGRCQFSSDEQSLAMNN